MDENRFSFKELYETQLKATSPMKIGKRNIEQGEPIVVFDNIQISMIREHTDRKLARGGYGNEAQAMWEQNRRIDLSFTQGVFSPLHLALLANAEVDQVQDPILVPKIERLQLDKDKKVKLSNQPVTEKGMFVFDSQGNKIIHYQVKENEVTFTRAPTDGFVTIHYTMYYSDNSMTITLGSKLITNFVELSGKTRLRDDKTGYESTAIITFPKVQLTSDLFLRLGRDANPIQGEFLAQAFPVGPKGRERVGKITILSTDIDNRWR